MRLAGVIEGAYVAFNHKFPQISNHGINVDDSLHVDHLTLHPPFTWLCCMLNEACEVVSVVEFKELVSVIFDLIDEVLVIVDQLPREGSIFGFELDFSLFFFLKELDDLSHAAN